MMATVTPSAASAYLLPIAVPAHSPPSVAPPNAASTCANVSA